MSDARRAMLIIMDGWGERKEEDGNAVKLAKTPFVDTFLEACPKTFIRTSGEDVGLPAGQMGNSEVGHLNLGAGRVVNQPLLQITNTIRNDAFFNLSKLKEMKQKLIANGNSIHLIGLYSDGGVHSHIEHCFALIDFFDGTKDGQAVPVFLHPFLDGRDTRPSCTLGYFDQLEDHLKKLPPLKEFRVATVSGRYYAMDRDKRWDRTEKAYRALMESQGQRANSAKQAVQNAYDRKETDEFVLPTVISEEGKNDVTLQENDAVIFFNFRPDRARQLTRALMEENFSEFKVKNRPKLDFLCFVPFEASFGLPILFDRPDLKGGISEIVSSRGLKQYHSAETEKYPHVTFFFNGGREKMFQGEARKLVDSPKVATYDLQPEMSACPVTEGVLEALRSDEYHFLLVNFANGDMVGHTGVLSAGIKAVETVDESLSKIIPLAKEKGWSVIVTADHGNCEQMKQDDGSPHTAHTTNVVPLYFVGDQKYKIKLREGGRLADIAPTLLDMMGFSAGEKMTGKSLLMKCEE